MNGQKLLILLIVLSIDYASAADDCGISTINLDNQESVISVQICIKAILSELNATLDKNEILVDRFRNKAQAIIDEEGLCKKFESYYKNAKKNKDEEAGSYFKINVDECYTLLGRRTKKVADFSGEYNQMKQEAKSIKNMIMALENKYNMLTGQLKSLR